MVKFCFKVFDRVTGEMKYQVITNIELMFDTLEKLSKLGTVKGFILDDKESEVNNDISDL